MREIYEIKLSYELFEIEGSFSVKKAANLLYDNYSHHFDGIQSLTEYLEVRLIQLNNLGLLLFDGFEFSANNYNQR